MPEDTATREYFLKFALVRQLAHREKMNAGRMNKKYIGSKYMI